MPICIESGSFGFEVWRSQVGNKRTDGQRGEERWRTLCPRPEQTGVRVFAYGIAFVCFYDAERVLSAIAKFTCCLFTSSGKRRGEMKFEKGEVGEYNGEGTRRVWKGGKWECKKNSAKTQHN